MKSEHTKIFNKEILKLYEKNIKEIPLLCDLIIDGFSYTANFNQLCEEYVAEYLNYGELL